MNSGSGMDGEFASLTAIQQLTKVARRRLEELEEGGGGGGGRTD